MTAELLVVGTGMVGASIGMALEGRGVLLADHDEPALAAALARGAGQRWDGAQRARHGVLAVPPSAVAPALARMHAHADTWSHVSSVQAPVQQALERLPAALQAQTCGTHPLAGKERSGPQAAAADLFAGRPWALCPAPATSQPALTAAREMAQACGAVPVELSAPEHDAAVALLSHLPQVAASALAASLLRAGDEPLLLSGPGLQDTTRIAASDPGLWGQILRQNAAAVAPLVRALGAELLQAADDLDAGDDLHSLISRGNAGRALVPVKRGSTDADFAVVRVRVADRRGQLAGVLVAAAEAGIDVEDVRVEHLPGRASGVIELVVGAERLDGALARLAAAGWDATA